MLRSTRLLLASIVLLLLTPTSVFAQETPEVAEETLMLGDEVTGLLEVGERRRHAIDVAGVTEPFDIILFAPSDIILNVYDAEDHRIASVDNLGPNSREVFSWVSGDDIPAKIEVSVYSNNETTNYSLLLLPAESFVSEEAVAGEQVKRWTEVEFSRDGQTHTEILPNLLYLPEDYDEQQSYPLVVFLHGAAERGSRLDFLKAQGIPKLIEDGEDFPFIMAAPQIEPRVFWTSKLNVLASFIEQLQAEFSIDADRIYIVGMSLGGSGVWNFALEYPDIPAAMVSVAGFYFYGNDLVPDVICDITHIPMWIVHSEADEIFAFEAEQGLVERVEECGGDVQFTAYPDTAHFETFDPAFSDPALYDWLLQQHR
jgi:hypothetical protein